MCPSEPSADEPIAWAIYGKVTGNVREVTLDEDEANELREFYDVVPLYRMPERLMPSWWSADGNISDRD
jgi:hypothetical protein